MRSDSSGNVGVGLSPSEKFMVSGPIVAKGTLVSHQTSSGVLEISGNESRIRCYGATPGSGYLVFRTGGGGASSDSEAMRIDSSGRVGIGTSTFYDDTRRVVIHRADSGSSYLQFTNSASGESGQNGSLIGHNASNQLSIYNLENSAMVIGTSAIERMRIDSSGKVGIGTNSPASFSSSANNLVVQDTDGEGGITIVSTNTGSSNIFFADTDATAQGQIKYQHAGDYMRFYTAAAEKMRIDSSGNVGIGTSSPVSLLELESATDNGLTIRRHATDITANDTIGISFALEEDTTPQAFTAGYVKILAEQSLGGSATSRDAALIFGTATDGSSAERMRIDSSGNVGIGTSSPQASQKLHIYNSAGNAEMTIQSADGSDAALLFGDTTDFSRGKIKYTSSDEMVFEVNNLTERMRIDSSGNVGIGTNNPSQLLELSNGNNPCYIVQTRGSAQTILGPTGNLVNSECQVGTVTNSPFRIVTNNTGRLWVDEAGKVGIGTNTPSSILTISSAFTQTITAKRTDNESGSMALRSIGSSDLENAKLLIGGGSGANLISFYTGVPGSLSERMRIDSGGALMIGKQALDVNTIGHQFDNSGLAYHTRDGFAPLILNRKSSDGSVLVIQKDAATVGYIGAKSGDLFIGTGDTGILFDDANDNIIPVSMHDSGATRSEAISLGSTSYKFKDLHVSGTANIGASDIKGANLTLTMGQVATFTISNLKNGAFKFMLGGYTSGGNGACTLELSLAGYQTHVNMYNVSELVRWETGTLNISAITKNNETLVFTVTNNVASAWNSVVEWHAWGNPCVVDVVIT
jgi:hypothetical protein